MTITEVVVTAQKREEKLQEVPVAVSVVSGDTDLQRRNIGNVDQGSKLVRAPASRPPRSGCRCAASAPRPFSTSIEADEVSTVLDGVALGRPEMALRAASTTWPESRSCAGRRVCCSARTPRRSLVGITTNAPKLGRVEAMANLNFASARDGYDKSDATVNLPLGDKAALRVGGFVNKLDGVLSQSEGRPPLQR
ncbi:hypothetical protein ACRAWD_30305 [Caulobacter segnis]